MQLKIISQSGVVNELDTFISVSLVTDAGMVTILPHHEPILASIRPGILEVVYDRGEKQVKKAYVTGGGVLNVSEEDCTVLADMVDGEDTFTDLDYILEQKKEAERLVAMYRSENETIDPERMIAIEKDLVRYSLMHELGMKYREDAGGRG